MAIPPYMLPPNPWAAQLMAQQQVFAAAHAQQAMHAQMASQMQMQPGVQAGMQSTQMGHIPSPKQDIVNEEKLQEKCKWLLYS